jgi:mannose-1-phosphate guanylyltransferase
MTNILLAGGRGARLWPLSREKYPKQFCNLLDDMSLFQHIFLRNKVICQKTLIITNVEHYSIAKMQLKEQKIKNIVFILEPVGRNTAPAITIACFALPEDEIVLVTPSDHYIKGQEKYNEIINKAKSLAEAGYLVTFGIKPSYPETGYGYIEAEGETVISFKEKPDTQTAQEYIESGKYYWNSGMFMFKVKTYLDEVYRYAEDIFTSSRNAFDNKKTIGKTLKISKSYMERIPSTSIDYAVMEHSMNIKMAVLDINWSDLGSFEAIDKISTPDAHGNVSKPINTLVNSKNNFIISNNKPIVLIDVEDLVVVDTNDALLISKKGSSHKIKELLPEIEKSHPNITRYHADPNLA